MKINLAIYGVDVNFFVGKKELDAYDRACVKAGKTEDDRISNEDGRCWGVNVWIRKLSKSPYWIGVVAHEVTHCVDNLSYHVGIKHVDKPVAYLVGYITEQIYKKGKR